MYGDSDLYEINATECRITVAHTEITCITGAGAGVGHRMVLTIGGQQSTIPTIDYGAPSFRGNVVCAENDADHGKQIGGSVQCACSKCPSVTTTKTASGASAKIIPAITIGASPCWHPAVDSSQSSSSSSCSLPIPSESDVDGTSRLSTNGHQLILLSGINFGQQSGSTSRNSSTSELEAVTYGKFGREFSMEIFGGGNGGSDGSSSFSLIPPGRSGCAIHEPSFSILCNTKAGIAGPHKWIVTVKGQVSQASVVVTRYAAPIIESREPATGLLSTDGTTTVVLAGIEFGTNDALATFK